MAADQEDEGREEERREQEVQEEAERTREYMQWRRSFDRLKVEHKATQADSEKLKANGNSFFKLGLYMQASMMYSEAIELQPENAVLYCNRSMAYLKQDMPHEALADAETSLELDASEANIKAYWRKAQSLLDLNRPDDSEATSDIGLAMEPGNQHLNRVRRRAREVITLRRICGDDWVTTMNGVEKRYTFKADGTMKITVFGHAVPATFDLSVEGNPRSMVVRMSPEAIGMGNGPPPPPRPYIYEFHDNDQELWLCQPVGSDILPTKFEGPGFDRLRRAAPLEAPAAVEDDTDVETLDERCAKYIEEMNGIMPLIPPQLPAQPSEEEMAQEVRIMDQLSQLKRRHGMRVHARAVELAKNPGSAPSPELAAMALELQRRFVARRILPVPPPPKSAAIAEAAPIAAAAAAALQGAAPAKAALVRAGGCLAGIGRLCGR